MVFDVRVLFACSRCKGAKGFQIVWWTRWTGEKVLDLLLCLVCGWWVERLWQRRTFEEIWHHDQEALRCKNISSLLSSRVETKDIISGLN